MSAGAGGDYCTDRRPALLLVGPRALLVGGSVGFAHDQRGRGGRRGAWPPRCADERSRAPCTCRGTSASSSRSGGATSWLEHRQRSRSTRQPRMRRARRWSMERRDWPQRPFGAPSPRETATTPVGAYSIGPVMYGIAPDPGVAYPYHRIVCGDWWDEARLPEATTASSTCRAGTAPPFGGDARRFWRVVPQYDYFAVVDLQLLAGRIGRGSAIFVHVTVGAPTAGCIALGTSQAASSCCEWLRPVEHPEIGDRRRLRGREGCSWRLGRGRGHPV